MSLTLLTQWLYKINKKKKTIRQHTKAQKHQLHHEIQIIWISEFYMFPTLHTQTIPLKRFDYNEMFYQAFYSVDLKYQATVTGSYVFPPVARHRLIYSAALRLWLLPLSNLSCVYAYTWFNPFYQILSNPIWLLHLTAGSVQTLYPRILQWQVTPISRFHNHTTNVPHVFSSHHPVLSDRLW